MKLRPLFSAYFLISYCVTAMENPEQRAIPPIIATLPTASLVSCVSYSADGKKLVLAGANNIQIWDTGNFVNPQRVIQENDLIRCVDIDPDNTNFAAGGKPLNANYGMININDLQTGATTKVLIDSKEIDTVQYLQNEASLLSASENGSCKIWDLKANRRSYKNYDAKAGGAWCANLNPVDANTFAAVYDMGNTVALWDTRVENKPITTVVEQVPSTLVRFNDEGKLLVGGRYTMMLRDQKLKLLATYTMQGKKVPLNQGVMVPIGQTPVLANAFKFMPQNPNSVFAALNNDQMLFIDLEDSNNSFEFAVPDILAAQGVDINPDGKTMAVGCWGAKTLIYDISGIDAVKKQAKEQAVTRETGKSNGQGWSWCGYQ